MMALVSMRFQGSSKSEIIRDWGMHRGAGVWTEIGWGVLAGATFLSVTILGWRTIFMDRLGILDELLWRMLPVGLLWAPVCEEVLFRGALYRELRGTCRWWIAALANGVFFAAWHPPSILSVWYIAIGFLACALREWRDSVIALITLHFCINAYASGVWLAVLW